MQGMTCSGCEQHVAVALENMGAKAIEVDFRRGEAVFELPDDVKVEDAKMRLLTQTITPRSRRISIGTKDEFIEKYRLNVEGMTCTGCEEHIAVALENAGAKGIEVDFRRGEALFELPYDVDIDIAKTAITDAQYQRAKQKKYKCNRKKGQM